MRKKPFILCILVAAVAATSVLIRQCHRRVTSHALAWNSNLHSHHTQFKTPKPHEIKDSLSYMDFQNHRKYPKDKHGYRRFTQNPLNRETKPISAKMAYELLTILWGKNQESKNILLQKMQKDSIRTAQELQWQYQHFVSIPTDFNPNDSIGWFQLPGFKKKDWFAIKRYRDKLGGFCQLNQVLEIRQLDTFWKTIIAAQKLPPFTQSPVQKISAQSSWKELYQHPYIGPAYARIIYQYYQQHPQPSCEEISKLQGLPEPHFKRLWPYLSKNCKD